MTHLPSPCVVDTNVPKTANLAIDPDAIPLELTECVFACVEAIEHVIKTGGLVLDAGDEIYNEYRQQLAMQGRPGIGDRFMKWVHDTRWTLPEVDRVSITANEDSYEEFPDHAELISFDRSDRKFVAVANAHPNRPPILEATDSKWWGWKDALTEAGVAVHFVCPGYARMKYAEKMGT